MHGVQYQAPRLLPVADSQPDCVLQLYLSLNGNWVTGMKEGTWWDEHWVLHGTNESSNTTTKTYDVLYAGNWTEKRKKKSSKIQTKRKKKIFPWMNSSYLVPTSGRVRVERGILTELELSHQAQIVIYLAFSIKSIRYSYTFMNVLHILTAYLRPCKLGH